MEHLLTKEQREQHRSNIITVPWLGFDHDLTEDYDVVFLTDYASVRGISESEQASWLQAPLKDPHALAFIQSWFFFGIWESAWGHRMRSKWFIRWNTDGTRVIDTRLLPLIMQHIRKEYAPKIRGTAFREYVQKRFSQTMERTWKIIQMLHARFEIDKPTQTFKVIFWFIKLAAETLESTQWILRDDDFGRHYWSSLYTQHPSGDGWLTMIRCPSQYWSLTLLGLCGMEYIRLIGLLDSSNRDHKNCTMYKCLVANVDPRTPPTRHVLAGCECDSIAVPTSTLYSFLSKGHIPLVDINSMLSDEPMEDDFLVAAHACAESGESRPRYAAFSHVWADGLGSVAEKGLPRCQLAYLQNVLNKYNERRDTSHINLVWIDSLCIPSHKESRERAIYSMNKIFREATITLVLDSDIVKMEFGNTVPHNLCVQIMCSRWNRRLWTLEEAYLSKSLHFVFKDRTVSNQEISAMLWKEPSSPIVNGLIRLLSVQRQSDRPISFGEAYDSTRGRITSKVGDVPLIVAIMLGMDVKRLTLYDGEERHREFWKMVGPIHPSVAFSGPGKLSLDGFRWAPSSLTNPEFAPSIEPPQNPAIVTELGLHGLFSLFFFDSRQTLRLEKPRILHDVEAENLELIMRFEPRDVEPVPSEIGFTAIAVDCHRENWAVERMDRRSILFLVEDTKSSESPAADPIYKCHGTGVMQPCQPNMVKKSLVERVWSDRIVAEKTIARKKIYIA